MCGADTALANRSTGSRPSLVGSRRSTGPAVGNGRTSQDFGGWDAFHDREQAIACYERHNQQVRDTCPPDRLLEWSVSDGWRPLCRALDLDEPPEPFPHLNRR